LPVRFITSQPPESDIATNTKNNMVLPIPYFAPFTTKIKINLTEENENEYMKIANGERVVYSTDGLYTIETAWQVIDVEFKNLSLIVG